MKGISIITVNYNTAQNLPALAESLQKHPPGFAWEWIIVDNDSGAADQQILDELEKSYGFVHVIRLSANLGFGAANGVGARFARGDILVVVNPDTLVHQGTLDRLVQALQDDPQAGIVAPVLQDEGGDVLESTREFPSVWELAMRRIGAQSHGDIPRQTTPVPWAQGSFFVTKKSFFLETLGGFDTRFFLFLEDTDLCRRAWETGSRVLLVPDARAQHGSVRLSGHSFSVHKKTFWIHLVSAWKYFWKYRGEKIPKVF